MKHLASMKSFLHQSSYSFPAANLEKWTIEVLRLLVFITIVPAIIVLISILTGVYKIDESHPIFIDLLLLIVGWQGAKRGGWRWARFIPPVVCFLLGTFSLGNYNIENTSILLYGFAVILSGFLQGNRTSFLFVLLCSITYTYVLWPSINSSSVGHITASLIVFMCLSGFLLIQWYFARQINLYISGQTKALKALEEECELRKKSEEARILQESQLKRLTDHMTDMVAEIDLDGNYLYASPSYFSVLGYHPEELREINAFSNIHPDDRAIALDAVQAVVDTGNPGQVQYRIRHAAGHYIWVQTSGIATDHTETSIKTLIISSHDITSQRLAEESNLASEQKYRSIIEGVPLGLHMYTLDENNNLVFSGYNPSADSILNLDHEKFLGKTIEEAFPGLIGTEIPDRYRDLTRTGVAWIGHQVIYKDEILQGAFEVHAFQTSPGKMAAFFSDITERIKKEEALRHSEAKFSTAFHTSPDSVNINRLVDGMYLDINQGFTDLTGFTREDVIGKTSVELNIWVNLEDRKKLVAGIKKDGYFQNLEADFRGKDGRIIRALMSASLIKVNGEDCLLSITRDITDRIRSEAQLRETHKELERAYEATLEGWARALDLREHETADHSRRVVEYTVRIASQMNFDENSMMDIQRGALLHDIGKVGVPDNILLKPGSLTDDEWVIMRQHPTNAFHLLKDIEYLQSALVIPYSHHERWDGSGYPQGLKGEEIPLAARIFAVVDVWDALLSNRPYRPAWDKKAVFHYLQEQSGKQFDPQVVRVFLQILDMEMSTG